MKTSSESPPRESGEGGRLPQEPDPKVADSGFLRVVRAVRYSLEGIRTALRHEAAFRQEAVAACFLVPIALWLPLAPVEKVLLVASIFAILIVELLNSALEWAVNHISLELHPLAKGAKDMASAAVFLAFLLCGLTWLILLSNRWGEIRLWLG